jgi:hypothetical protein
MRDFIRNAGHPCGPTSRARHGAKCTGGVPPAPSIPASLALSNVNGLIVYSGTVGDDATRTAIIDSLKTVFGADKITGDLAVDQHAGQAGWTKNLKTALENGYFRQARYF